MPQWPQLGLHDGSIKGQEACQPLKVAVWHLVALLACLGVRNRLVSHLLVMLVCCGLLEQVILWHSQGTDL